MSEKVKVDVNVFGNALGKLSEAVCKVAEVVLQRFETADKRTMQKAIRTGDKIVDRCKELSLDDKKLVKLLAKWDKYNN